MTPGLYTTASAIGRAVTAANSAYPPSFDNNPVIFGWALFARLLIALLAAATLVRIASRNQTEGIAANHPVYYHRMTVSCFLWGALLGASSDVITYLVWGETSQGATAIWFLVSRILDAMTMVPFLMALFVPLWMGWLVRAGIVQSVPSMRLAGAINDIRTTWDSPKVPLRLLQLAAFGAAGVTVFKYWLWLEHGLR